MYCKNVVGDADHQLGGAQYLLETRQLGSDGLNHPSRPLSRFGIRPKTIDKFFLRLRFMTEKRNVFYDDQTDNER